MDLFEIRRINLAKLAAGRGGQARLAEQSGKSSPYISEVIRGVKTLGEAAARSFERSAGLPLGALDKSELDEGLTSDNWKNLNQQQQSALLAVVKAMSQLPPPLTTDEEVLLGAYRRCTEAAKKVVRAVVVAQASQTPAAPKDSSAPPGN